MPISFNSIPINLRVPGQYVEFDNSKAIVGLPVMPNKILVIGQRLAAGTVLAGVPTQIFSADQAVQAFGQGSMLANMIRAAKNANPLTEMWAIAQDDNGAAAAATCTVTIGGAPTAASTYPLYIAGRSIQVPVTPASTPTSIAAAVAAAVNADLDGWVTAAPVLGVVTLTARNKGLAGNDIDVRNTLYPTDALPAGVTSAIVAMSGGTTNPVLTASIAATGDEWYNHWIVGYNDAASTTAIAAELDRRFGPTIMKEGHAYHGAAGSVGTLATLGNAQNSLELTTIGAQKSPTHPTIWAAVLGAQAAYYGNIDPARPLQTLPLPGVLPPAVADRFTFADRNTLLNDGISTFTVDPGGVVLIERVITMYRLNTQGLPDVSYLDVETLQTLFFIRYSVRSRIAQKFPRYKLAGDGDTFGAGQAIVRPKDIKIELIALASQWVDAGIMEDMAQFKTGLIVERDGTDVDRVNALIPPNVVNQFRIFAGKVQFIL